MLAHGSESFLAGRTLASSSSSPCLGRALLPPVRSVRISLNNSGRNAGECRSSMRSFEGDYCESSSLLHCAQHRQVSAEIAQHGRVSPAIAHRCGRSFPKPCRHPANSEDYDSACFPTVAVRCQGWLGGFGSSLQNTSKLGDGRRSTAYSRCSPSPVCEEIFIIARPIPLRPSSVVPGKRTLHSMPSVDTGRRLTKSLSNPSLVERSDEGCSFNPSNRSANGAALVPMVPLDVAADEEEDEPIDEGRPSDFLRKTWARVYERNRIVSESLHGPLEAPVRIAVVGAGPVGLWASVLIARSQSRLARRSEGVRVIRQPGASSIDIFEHRTADSGYGSRRILLALSNVSQDLLNAHLTSGTCLKSNHTLAPTCSINVIETLLRDEFERYAAAGFGSLRFGQRIGAPDDLVAEGYDVVFVAGGRGYPNDDWRGKHGMRVRVGESCAALILKFKLDEDATLDLADVQTVIANQSMSKSKAKVFLRPGATKTEGYLWVVGPGKAATTRIHASIERLGRDFSFPSLKKAWKQLTSLLPDGSKAKRLPSDLATMLAQVDIRLRPVCVSARLTEASFWHSEHSVHQVERPGRRAAWIVLIGDAVCGKPFYLGSTLNGHFQDAMTLCSAPWTQWDSNTRGGQPPFKQYCEQIKCRVGSASGFKGCGSRS